jgi:hypothetical protein
MPIQIEASDSTRKSIDLTVVPSATGVTVSGSIRWFDDLFNINTVVPCVYSDDAAYRVALCRHANGPALVLVEDDALPAGYTEVCSPIRWRFTQASDTCASVDVFVVKRALVLDPENPLPAPTVRNVPATPVLPVASPERTEGRKVRRRIRELRVALVALKDAGTTVTAMTAAQRNLVVEYVGLTGEAAPLAVP